MWGSLSPTVVPALFGEVGAFCFNAHGAGAALYSGSTGPIVLFIGRHSASFPVSSFMPDIRWLVSGQVVRTTLFPSVIIDDIGSAGLSPSRATTTSNVVFQGSPNTTSSRNTWFCEGVCIVSAVVRFFGGALGAVFLVESVSFLLIWCARCCLFPL